MRKYGLYLLIAVSLMTGCQKKDTVTVDTAAETTQESSETGLKAESEPESTAENLSGTDQNGRGCQGGPSRPNPNRGKRGI